jgi:cell division protein FtsI/penicillin-binding protein 2
MVEHGGHGGSAAAPIVKAVMQEFFRTRFVGPQRKGGA